MIHATASHKNRCPQVSRQNSPDQRQQTKKQQQKQRSPVKAPTGPFFVKLRPEDVERMRSEAPILTAEEVRSWLGPQYVHFFCQTRNCTFTPWPH
mgnify:CR=1 FL=1